MKKKLFILFLSLVTTAASAEFSTKAKSAFLIDYDSGTEIVAKNADVLMPPSSMIKLMTLVVLFDEIKAGRLTMDDRITVGKNADYNDPKWYPASKICLVEGQSITVRDLILGLIVLSGGDASVVVAEKAFSLKFVIPPLQRTQIAGSLFNRQAAFLFHGPDKARSAGIAGFG